MFKAKMLFVQHQLL